MMSAKQLKEEEAEIGTRKSVCDISRNNRGLSEETERLRMF